MSTFDEFLVNSNRIAMDIIGGRCQVHLDKRLIYDGKYVTGDMEDKLACLARGYKVLVELLLEELS